MYLFADATVILFEDKDWSRVQERAERDIYIVKKWFDQNCLTLNITQTKVFTNFTMG